MKWISGLSPFFPLSLSFVRVLKHDYVGQTPQIQGSCPRTYSGHDAPAPGLGEHRWEAAPPLPIWDPTDLVPQPLPLPRAGTVRGAWQEAPGRVGQRQARPPPALGGVSGPQRESPALLRRTGTKEQRRGLGKPVPAHRGLAGACGMGE